MIIERIKNEIPPGIEIPKPNAKERFLIKGWGKRRQQEALIYFVPNHNNPNMPYQKGITVSEFETAYRQLVDTGELTRKWFNEHLSFCAGEGPCNFTTVGGVLELLGVCKYESLGIYRWQK
jgi:hypothetical protein